MTARRILAIVCYTACMAAYGVCGFLSYQAMTSKISYVYGFLLFLPIWISSYWFSTFFSQLIYVKKGEKTVCLLDKTAASILSGISSFISVVLLVLWGYIYIFRVLDTSGIPILDDIVKHKINKQT